MENSAAHPKKAINESANSISIADVGYDGDDGYRRRMLVVVPQQASHADIAEQLRGMGYRQAKVNRVYPKTVSVAYRHDYYSVYKVFIFVADVEYNDDDGYDQHVLMEVPVDATPEDIRDQLYDYGYMYVEVNDVYAKTTSPSHQYDYYSVCEMLD